MPDPARAAAAARLPDRIAFLGLGLIGGSVAHALRDAGYRGTVAAWTPGRAGPMEAVRRGIVDDASATPEAALDGAGLVILAGPPMEMLRTAGALGSAQAGHVTAGTTITDVVSTKAAIGAAADAANLHFVGGHPMAGRELSGVGAATADLFVGRPWVVVPGVAARPEDVDRVEALAAATGARTVRMTAADHDAAVAAISHLPLVVAAALVESVVGSADVEGVAAWPAARELAASGWRDTTRLARGDTTMGAGMLATNAANIYDRLVALRAAIDGWLELLDPSANGADTAEADGILARLQAARDALGDPPS